jgi:hypothetical protein
MRILVVCNQRPLPTFHGANADIWRVIRALQTGGADVACISWRDSIADDAYLDQLNKTVQYLEFPMDYGRRPGRREAQRMPEFASLRRLSAHSFSTAVDFGRRFEADCVLLLGLYGGELGMDLAAALGRPFVYRSHAIETGYHEEYFRLRRETDSRYRSLAQFRRDESQLRAISRFEQMVVSRAGLTLEISADDLHARRRHSSMPISHLPPFVSTASDVSPHRRDTYDVCYVGNLFMPNNQQGLLWFARDVLPSVLDAVGPLRVVVAGKSLDRDFVRLLVGYGIDVVPNPTDTDEIIAGSRVGVNPIFAGNGTTLKTLDYLWSGCAVVTTPIGIQGFRFEDTNLPLTVAASVASFSRAIVQRLQRQQPLSETRGRLGRYSWEGGGPQLVEALRHVAGRTAPVSDRVPAR